MEEYELAELKRQVEELQGQLWILTQGDNWLKNVRTQPLGTTAGGGPAPGLHKTTHQNTGGDEISVTGLSGLLADDQHVLDSEAIAAVQSEATLDLTGTVTVNPDTDVVATIGRAKVGYIGALGDLAAFAHYDCDAATDYSIAQAADGATHINAKTGVTIKFRINNASGTEMLFSAGNLIMHDGQLIEVDTINEATAAAGVTIDGVTCKDGYVGMDAIGEGDVAVPAATLAHLFYEETGGGVSGAATLMTLGVANQQAAAVKKLRVKDSAGTVTDVVSW